MEEKRLKNGGRRISGGRWRRGRVFVEVDKIRCKTFLYQAMEHEKRPGRGGKVMSQAMFSGGVEVRSSDVLSYFSEQHLALLCKSPSRNSASKCLMKHTNYFLLTLGDV